MQCRTVKGGIDMYANEKEIKDQIDFIKKLVSRLDEKQCVSQLKADAIRIRRELNELVKMQKWEYR